MPREKHGQYDPERGLPDNRGQAVGSGLILWFHEQIRQRLPDGDALVEKSRVHRSSATKWLLEQLVQREETKDLPQEYHERQKKDAVEREWRQKEAEARRIEWLLANEEDMHPGRRDYLEKDLAKRRRAIEKHRVQQHE